jgi:hypothetical protein
MEGPRFRLYISSRCVNKHGRHRELLFMVGQFLKIFSETARPEPKFGRKHLWKLIYSDCIFHPDGLTIMVAIGNPCFWLANF